MKYKDYIIMKVKEDLGEEDDRLNYIYNIYKNGKFVINALTVCQAIELIDSNFADCYL